MANNNKTNYLLIDLQFSGVWLILVRLSLTACLQAVGPGQFCPLYLILRFGMKGWQLPRKMTEAQPTYFKFLLLSWPKHACHIAKPKVKGQANAFHLRELMAGMWIYIAIRDMKDLIPITESVTESAGDNVSKSHKWKAG